VARIINGRGHPVVETLRVRVKDSSQDNLAGELQSLTEAQYWADQYMHDRTVEEPVWLHAKWDSETGERRALVRSIEWSFESSAFGAESINDEAVLTITIERGAFWERTTARALPYFEIPSESSTGAESDLYDYTQAGSGGSPAAHDLEGDVPARIDYFEINSVSGNLGRIWMGIRSQNKFDVDPETNFIEVWNPADGTMAYTEVTNATGFVNVDPEDGSAEVTWDDTWQKVLDLEWDDVDSGSEDVAGMFGRLLWILVAASENTSPATTWEVKLKYGYAGMDDADFVEMGRVIEITETSANLFEAGLCHIPLRSLHAITTSNLTSSLDSTFTIQIYARRTSGAGDLNINHLLPVPVDEGYFFSQFDDTNEYLVYGESPRGEVDANILLSAAQTFDQVARIESNNFRLPPGDGVIVVVYAPASEEKGSSDSIEMEPSENGQYYERWLSLRGSE
jgi:hypothetical protein